jgi:hypothetical protein
MLVLLGLAAAFRRFMDSMETPERCLEAYPQHRTRFELVAERKLRNRQLTDDGTASGRPFSRPRSQRRRHDADQ